MTRARQNCTAKRSINCITQQIMSNEIKTDEVGVAGGTYVTEKCIQDFGRNNLREETARNVCVYVTIISKRILKKANGRLWTSVSVSGLGK